jgi:membrane-associated phospholipid phosphatase
VLGALDRTLLRVLRTRLHQPPVERAALAFTRAGEHGTLWLAIAGAGAGLDRRSRPSYARAARAVLLGYAVNTLVKYAVRRPRPRIDDLPPLTRTISPLSYPSAHATTSFAGARALRRALPGAPLYGIAAAMALSRPYAGVHYPSDALAGAALGTALEALLP